MLSYEIFAIKGGNSCRGVNISDALIGLTVLSVNMIYKLLRQLLATP